MARAAREPTHGGAAAAGGHGCHCRGSRNGSVGSPPHQVNDLLGKRAAMLYRGLRPLGRRVLLSSPYVAGAKIRRAWTRSVRSAMIEARLAPRQAQEASETGAPTQPSRP